MSKQSAILLQKATLAERSMGCSPAYILFKKACKPRVIIELLGRLEAAELKLAMYEGFDAATEDGFFEPPHPIFMLAEENDKLKSTIKAISELPEKWRSECCDWPSVVNMELKRVANELQALLKEQS